MKYVLLTCFLFSAALGPAQNHADCDSAVWLGNQAAMHFIGAYGEGADTDEAAFTPCFINGENFGQAETNSTWIRFGIAGPGTLRFTIIPDEPWDDYDFVLYRIPPGGRCKDKEIVRCMAAGDKPSNEKSPCLGRTGLRDKEKDTSADAGCSDRGDNNWLKPVDVKAEEEYVLLASNITQPYVGFVLRFYGDFVFRE